MDNGSKEKVTLRRKKQDPRKQGIPCKGEHRISGRGGGEITLNFVLMV